MEWIKCSDKMPKIGVKVLFFPKNDEPIHGEFGGQYWRQDTSWCVSNDCIDRVITSEVTHWMPLPEPPSE